MPRWRWVLPVTLAILATIASVVVAAPFLAAEAKIQMAAVLSRMSVEQLAQMPKQLAAFQTPLFVGTSAALTGILALLIGYLFQAAALYFGSLIAGGEIDFGRLFAATPWIGLPFVLESAVQTVYIAVNGRLIVNPGLSYLVSTGSRTADVGSLAYAALGHGHVVLAVASASGLQAPPSWTAIGRRRGVHCDAAVRGYQRGRASRFCRPESVGKPTDVGRKSPRFRDADPLGAGRLSREKIRQSLFNNSTPDGKAHDFFGSAKGAIIMSVIARKIVGKETPP